MHTHNDNTRAMVALHAYRHGAFPMAHERDDDDDTARTEVSYYIADPRAIFPFDGLHVSRTLRQRVRSKTFRITSDTAFGDVVRLCRDTRVVLGTAHTPDDNPDNKKDDRDHGSWIDDEIIAIAESLHDFGVAHSVEAWRGTTLVGGLYGIAIGGVFCGESMVSLPQIGGTDASKVCFVHLINHLKIQGFCALDAQIISEHTRSLGAIEIPLDDFLATLARERDRTIEWNADAIACVPDLQDNTV